MAKINPDWRVLRWSGPLRGGGGTSYRTDNNSYIIRWFSDDMYCIAIYYPVCAQLEMLGEFDGPEFAKEVCIKHWAYVVPNIEFILNPPELDTNG